MPLDSFLSSYAWMFLSQVRLNNMQKCDWGTKSDVIFMGYNRDFAWNSICSGALLTIYSLYMWRKGRKDRLCITLSCPLHWDPELLYDLVDLLAISAPLPLWKGSSLCGSTAVPHPSKHQIKGRTAAAQHSGTFSEPSTCIFWLKPEADHICFDSSEERFLPHWRVTSSDTTWHMDYYIVHLMAHLACFKIEQ